MLAHAEQLKALEDKCRRLEQRVRELEDGPQSACGIHDGTSRQHAADMPELPSELDDHHAFLDVLTVRPAVPPLGLPVVTLERVQEVCEGRNIALLLYRLAEAPCGMNLAQVMAAADAEALWHPDHVALGLQYASTQLLKIMEVPSAAALRPRITKMWSTNPSFRNDWQGTLRNLFAGRPHATMQRGVIYQNCNGLQLTLNNYMTSYVVAEFEPASGKTYLALARRSELLAPSSARVQVTAQQNLMALKYSPNKIIMASCANGRIHWQNSASCAAIGTVASDVALPIRGVCGEFELDYVGQLFWGNATLRKEMEQSCGSGLVFKRRMQIKGPLLRQLLGVAASQREVWHHVQVCAMKDPASHEQMYMISQSDVTDVVMAERRVKQLQKQQLSLLKEMLPQQVIDVLMSQKNGTPAPQRLSVANAPASASSSGHGAVGSGTADSGTMAAGGAGGAANLGDEALWPLTPGVAGLSALHRTSLRSASSSFSSVTAPGSFRVGGAGSETATAAAVGLSNLWFGSPTRSPRAAHEREHDGSAPRAPFGTPPRAHAAAATSSPPSSTSRLRGTLLSSEGSGLDEPPSASASASGHGVPAMPAWARSPFSWNPMNPSRQESLELSRASVEGQEEERHATAGDERQPGVPRAAEQPAGKPHSLAGLGPDLDTDLAIEEPSMANGIAEANAKTACSPASAVSSDGWDVRGRGMQQHLAHTSPAAGGHGHQEVGHAPASSQGDLHPAPVAGGSPQLGDSEVDVPSDGSVEPHVAVAVELDVAQPDADRASNGSRCSMGRRTSAASDAMQPGGGDRRSRGSKGKRVSIAAGHQQPDADRASGGNAQQYGTALSLESELEVDRPAAGGLRPPVGRSLGKPKSFKFLTNVDSSSIDNAITSTYCNWSESDRLRKELRRNAAHLLELRLPQQDAAAGASGTAPGAQHLPGGDAQRPQVSGGDGGCAGQDLVAKRLGSGQAEGEGRGSGLPGQGQGRVAGEALGSAALLDLQSSADRKVSSEAPEQRQSDAMGADGLLQGAGQSERLPNSGFERGSGLASLAAAGLPGGPSLLRSAGSSCTLPPCLRTMSSNVRSSYNDRDTPRGLQLSRRDVMALSAWHEEVTILFTDIKGFTSLSSSLHPGQVMLFLNHLFSLFDELVSQYDVFKVETIGDCYMVAGGLFDRSGYLSLDAEGNVVPSPEALAFTHGPDGPDGAPGEPERPSNGMDSASQDAVLLGADVADRTSPSMLSGMGSKPDRNILGGYDPEHAAKVLAFAQDMSAVAANVIDPLGNRVQMRVGIHTGSVMSGVVGRKCPRFCLFGDTVNTASRMESTGEPGRIHVSQAFRDLLPHEPWQPHEVFAKGKGTLTTYFLDCEAPSDAAGGQGLV